jgi:hypothetical protein
MTVATVLGIFLVPVLFVLVERLSKKKAKVTVEVLRPAEMEGGHD